MDISSHKNAIVDAPRQGKIDGILIKYSATQKGKFRFA